MARNHLADQGYERVGRLRDKLEATVVALPGRDDVIIPVEEQLIVEFCSR